MPVDYTAEIAEIEDVLNSGITETMEDGQMVRLDLQHLRRRLAELKRLSGLKKKRPRFGSINLGS